MTELSATANVARRRVHQHPPDKRRVDVAVPETSVDEGVQGGPEDDRPERSRGRDLTLC